MENKVVPTADLWAVPRLFPDSTWVCIASGQSLTDDQVEHARKAMYAEACHVAVCNNNVFKAPWADHLHFCDREWFDWYGNREEFINFTGRKTTCDRTLTIDCPEAHVLKVNQDFGLSQNPSLICGSSSGQQIINIASLYGAKKIILIGYELQPQPHDATVNHWFGKHPRANSISSLAPMLAGFSRIPPDAERLGIDIINCSHNTAIECFKRDTIENALKF